jgi:lipopolysaccharide/colanic/teichoic acid biosynthesis glycosyltransferase
MSILPVVFPERSGEVLISSWCSSSGKRALDIALASLVLAAALPILGIIAVAVRLSSPGPALFRQIRVGVNGKQFVLLKFRTMHIAADRVGPGVTRRNDPRIFPLGGLLRRWKLDELPQLLNVLRGDMSMVGPRPDLPEFCARLAKEERAILQLRPGATGVATLVYRDEERILAERGGVKITEFYVNQLYPEKVRLDLEYARVASFAGDIRILARTITAIFSLADPDEQISRQ